MLAKIIRSWLRPATTHLDELRRSLSPIADHSVERLSIYDAMDVLGPTFQCAAHFGKVAVTVINPRNTAELAAAVI